MARTPDAFQLHSMCAQPIFHVIKNHALHGTEGLHFRAISKTFTANEGGFYGMEINPLKTHSVSVYACAFRNDTTEGKLRLADRIILQANEPARCIF